MHSLMLGATTMGKTRLARWLAADYIRRGVNVLALDPHRSDHWRWPAGTWITRDLNAMRAKAERSQRCAVMLDEAGRLVGRGATAAEHQWFTTEIRHDPWYHLVYLITQTAQQLDPTLRGQCSVGYIFRLAPLDARFASDLFTVDLMRAASLKRGEFLYVRMGDEPEFMTLPDGA